MNRWSVSEGSEKDDILVQVNLNNGWGRRETLGVVILPLVSFFIFSMMTSLTAMFSSVNPNSVRDFVLVIILISLGLVSVFFLLIYTEFLYFRAFPARVLTVFHNREFTLGDGKERFEIPAGSILRYTLHYPRFEMQAGASFSELDLVIRDGDVLVAVHKLIAHKHDGCWRHAKAMSKLTSLPLERLPLKSDGSRFPAPINWQKSNS